MAKLTLSQPTLFMLYGYPGSGKTYFARQLCDELQAAHLQGDKVRFELFNRPRFDKQEDEIVAHVLKIMTEQFLSAGISVVYDVNVMRSGQRKKLRELASNNKAKSVLVWFQIDVESAFERVAKRDRRKMDDKYNATMDRTTYDNVTNSMQNPNMSENYMVVSGKRTFHTQRSAMIKRLYDMGLLQADQTVTGIAKPNLVNLVPNMGGGRVDPSRRNISIR